MVGASNLGATTIIDVNVYSADSKSFESADFPADCRAERGHREFSRLSKDAIIIFW